MAAREFTEEELAKMNEEMFKKGGVKKVIFCFAT